MTKPITTTDKLAVIARELKMRRRVYPRWVADGKMKQADADHQIAVMDAIAEDYRIRAEAERMTHDLFGQEPKP